MYCRALHIGLVALGLLLKTTLVVASTAGTLYTTDDNRRVPIPEPDVSTQPVLVIDGATLIDGRGGAAIPDARLVIRGKSIIAAGARSEVAMPERVDRRMDASGHFLVPGLIDLHIHFTQQRGDDFSAYRDSDVAAAIRGTVLLGQLLDGGITTVRELGTFNDVGIRLKEAVARGLLEGPRILQSNKIIASRGGHADEITSTATGRPKSPDNSARVRTAAGPWDWREAVREQIRMHADWIKLTAPYTREEVAAAVDEAHLHEIKVAVDSFGQFSMWAAEAGVDSIEHPLAMDKDILRAMAKHGTDLVPTLTAFYNVIATGYPPAGIPPSGFYYTMSRRFPVVHKQHLMMVGEAHKLGIRIGVGTDIPFENERRYPSDYFTELGFLRDAGLSNTEVLAAATRVGAEILGMDDKLGTLEPGKLADLLILAADPREDIQNLQALRAVLANGRVVRNAGGF